LPKKKNKSRRRRRKRSSADLWIEIDLFCFNCFSKALLQLLHSTNLCLQQHIILQECVNLFASTATNKFMILWFKDLFFFFT
jgi:hypothetical protein